MIPSTPRLKTMINLNDFVWIKLRPNGLALIESIDQEITDKYRAVIHIHRRKRLEEEATTHDGWTRWQLWDVMNNFGAVMHLGCDPPFETEIELTEPEVANRVTPQE